jgi:Protein-L-isoaspartate carboxylmethyltransferase
MNPNGIMVIPVGPPGAQHALKVTKQQAADGSISIARSDIYHGGRVFSCHSPGSKGIDRRATPSTSDWRF